MPTPFVLASLTLWIVAMMFIPLGIDLIVHPGSCLSVDNCIVLTNGTIIYNNLTTICTAQPNTQFACVWDSGQACPMAYYCDPYDTSTNIKLGWVLTSVGVLFIIIPCILMCFSEE